MSSVLVEYPEGLPAPTVGEVRASERRAVSTVGQLRNVRTLQRDRHGTRSVAFTFTPTQAAIFREWWVEWLQLGGGWFAANWALPWGRGPHVFRFNDPPQWQLIGGRLDGQGYWQVRAVCEIRGRGMLPTAEVMYLTSTPYPISHIDGIGINGGDVKPIPVVERLDSMQIYAKVLDATASSYGFKNINCIPESVNIAASVTAASAAVTVTVYSKYIISPESMYVSAKVSGATGYIVRVEYKNYVAESIAITAQVKQATATGV